MFLSGEGGLFNVAKMIARHSQTVLMVPKKLIETIKRLCDCFRPWTNPDEKTPTFATCAHTCKASLLNEIRPLQRSFFFKHLGNMGWYLGIVLFFFSRLVVCVCAYDAPCWCYESKPHTKYRPNLYMLFSFSLKCVGSVRDLRKWDFLFLLLVPKYGMTCRCTLDEHLCCSFYI